MTATLATKNADENTMRTALSLEKYVKEMNRRLRLHADYRAGMRVVVDPLTAALGGSGSYTFEWPKPEIEDDRQSWFDTRRVVIDTELQMREQYQLEPAVV
ncbi:MAG TPA: hypothetical protein VGN52_12985 [Burkholderiales bacterium]